MRNMYLSKIVSVARQMKVYVDFSSNGVELEFRWAQSRFIGKKYMSIE